MSGPIGTNCRESPTFFEMSDHDDALHAAVVPFGDEIGDLLQNVFGEPVTIDVRWLRGRFLVGPSVPLRLTIGGEALG